MQAGYVAIYPGNSSPRILSLIFYTCVGCVFSQQISTRLQFYTRGLLGFRKVLMKFTSTSWLTDSIYAGRQKSAVARLLSCLHVCRIGKLYYFGNAHALAQNSCRNITRLFLYAMHRENYLIVIATVQNNMHYNWQHNISIAPPPPPPQVQNIPILHWSQVTYSFLHCCISTYNYGYGSVLRHQ